MRPRRTQPTFGAYARRVDANGGRPAKDIYSVEVCEPAAARRIARVLATLTLGFLTWGAGPTNPGGRRVLIRDARSGELLASWTEGFSDETVELIGRIRDDHLTLTASDFAKRWIEPAADD